ncbi:MAG: thiamine pyrophosphate-binding protein [Myxococcota bacterium]
MVEHVREVPEHFPPSVAPRRRRSRDDIRRAVDWLVDELLASGVDTIFGVPGGALAPLLDALVDRPELRVVTNRHENHAVFAAAGYAQTTGRLGVALVTSGPGILNALNGLGSARTDHLPVLLIAGESARQGHGKGAVQEGSTYALGVVRMCSSIAKLAWEVPEGSSMIPMLRRSIATAMSGQRGPVVLSLPVNVQGQETSRPSVCSQSRTEFGVDSQALAHAVLALNSASSTFILAGSGLRGTEAPELLLELAERIQCPVATTPKGKGVFPEDHPLSVGIFGMGGHPSSSAALGTDTQTVLVLGSSLGEVATDGWNPALGGKRSLIHVDIDASRIGRNYVTDLAVVSDVAVFLRTVLPHIEGGRPKREFGRTFATDPSITAGPTGGLSPMYALQELENVVPDDTIFTADSGNNLFFATHYLTSKRPDAFVAFLGLGSMGSSLAGSVGVQLAAPERSVVSINGDGGFAMAAAELSTAALLHLPIIVAVLNDQRMGMVEYGLTQIFGRSLPYPTGPLDIASLARACGAESITITEAGQITAAAKQILARGGPLVLDIHIDPESPIPSNRRLEKLKEAGKKLKKGF